MIDILYLIFTIIILVISLRTLSYHLQSWQIREYRWDRMKSYLSTKDGKRNFWNFWFFPGIFPRPKKSGRIFMIIGIFIITQIFIVYPWFLAVWYIFSQNIINQDQTTTILSFLLLFLVIDRLIFLTVFFSVKISEIPVNILKQVLYYQAKKIREQAGDSITVIGITGSFGKSSTKELLVHLLTQEFGSKNILYNPENNNTEVAIARLIKKNPEFFTKKGRKFFVCEIGAYRRGEIATVCRFIQPDYSIITGLTPQHLDLFGSERNLEKAKLELAYATKKKVYYNADNTWLKNAINTSYKDKAIACNASSEIKNPEYFIDHIDFEFSGKNFTLPWGGKHFLQNTLLSMSMAHQLGVSIKNLAKYLNTISPLTKALSVEILDGNITILKDLYSANPEGVFAAIDHLATFRGKKSIIMQPLLELGDQSEKIHKKIFQKILEIPEVNLYWLKSDHSILGKNILSERFISINTDDLSNINLLKDIKGNLEQGSEQVILLEGRLPEKILGIFLSF